MNDGYIAQDDKGGREQGMHMHYMLRGCVSEIYFHYEKGHVQGNSSMIKTLHLRSSLLCPQHYRVHRSQSVFE